MGRRAKEAQVTAAAPPAPAAAEDDKDGPAKLDRTTKWLYTSGVVAVALIGMGLMAPAAEQWADTAEKQRIVMAGIIFWVVFVYRFTRKLIWAAEEPSKDEAKGAEGSKKDAPKALPSSASQEQLAGAAGGGEEDDEQEEEEGAKVRRRPRRA